MNNITTISYNIQVLYNNVNVLTSKMTDLENQILKLHNMVHTLQTSQASVETPRVETQIHTEAPKVDLSAIEDRLGLMEKQLTELKFASLQASRGVETMQSLLETPSSAEPVVSIAAANEMNDDPNDDILLSMTPVDNSSSAPKAKGGRKKKN